MRTGFLLAATGWLLSAAWVQAQSNALPPTGAPAQATSNPLRPPPDTIIGPEDDFWSMPAHDPEAGPDRIRVKAEYLLWWVRKGPVNTPLVTTGSPLDAVPGALDQPGTQVLFGDKPLDFGLLSGLRFTAGLDLCSGLSLEAGYLALERGSVAFSAVSDANGNPVIARPVFNNQGPAENAYLYAFPDTAVGSVGVTTHTRLQGGEFNVAANFSGGSGMHFTAFTGFRMLELNEDLNVIGNVMALVPGFLTFQGMPADPPNSLTDFDRFQVRNKFYGGQVGGRMHWRRDCFDLDVVGKIGLGSTQELVFINGLTALNSPGTPPVTNPGGLLTEPSNMGRFYHSTFGVIPELGINLGYWVTPQLRCTLGYNFLYWNRVLRPGNLIDRTVNPTQVARDPNFGNGLGDLRPLFQVHESDFWAQGVNFGLEFQF
jgi:hypothetical protein